MLKVIAGIVVGWAAIMFVINKYINRNVPNTKLDDARRALTDEHNLTNVLDVCEEVADIRASNKRREDNLQSNEDTPSDVSNSNNEVSNDE